MSKKKIDWSMYTFDDPRKTGFSRAKVFWMENGVIKHTPKHRIYGEREGDYIIL